MTNAIDAKLAKEAESTPKTAPEAAGVAPPPSTPADTPGAASGVEPALAARRQELRDIAEQQRARRSKREAEQNALAMLSQRAERAEAHARETSARLAAFEQELADPVALLQKRGITARQLGERILKEGTPDAQLEEATRIAREAKAEADRLRQEMQQRADADRRETSRLRAIQSLNSVFDAHKSALPILSKLGSERMVAEYMHTYNSVTTHPDTRMYSYTDAELLEATEARLRADAEAQLEALGEDVLEKALTKRRGSASVNGTAPQNGAASGKQDSGAAQSGRTGKTLTAALASSSSGSWRPDNWDKLSDKKQNELIAARLETGLPLD